MLCMLTTMYVRNIDIRNKSPIQLNSVNSLTIRAQFIHTYHRRIYNVYGNYETCVHGQIDCYICIILFGDFLFAIFNVLIFKYNL